MSTIDARAFNGSRARRPDGILTHFTADRRSPGNCQVTFHHPPINTPHRQRPDDAAPVQQDPSP